MKNLQTKRGKIVHETFMYIIEEKNGNTHAYADLYNNYSVMDEVRNIDDDSELDIAWDNGGVNINKPVIFKNGKTGRAVYMTTLYMIKDKKGNTYAYAYLGDWSVSDVRDFNDYNYQLNFKK